MTQDTPPRRFPEGTKATFWTGTSLAFDQTAPYLTSLWGGVAGLAIAPYLINKTSSSLDEHAEQLFDDVDPAKKGAILGAATSFPEIGASFFSTLRDTTEAANSNVQGSNIVNTMALLAIHSIFCLRSGRFIRFPDDHVTKTGVKYGAFAAALFVGGSALTLAAPAAATALGVSKNLVSGIIGSAFIGASVMTLRSYIKATSASPSQDDDHQAPPQKFWTKGKAKQALWTGVSLAGLMFAASAFVTAGVTTATAIGASVAAIGLIYAVGTSIPEMMVMWNSYSKAHNMEKQGKMDEAHAERGTAVGNVLGSNIFNPLVVGPVIIGTSMGVGIATGSKIGIGAGFLTSTFGIALGASFLACPAVLAALIYRPKDGWTSKMRKPKKATPENRRQFTFTPQS